jgi:anti-sigma regulatory factor (Ser/Thr protein kinase)
MTLVSCGDYVVGGGGTAGDRVDEALRPGRDVDDSTVPALCVRLPAEPASLAIVRAQLRQWFQSAGIGSDTAADLLLAVGEAASNAAEHAHDGAEHKVELTVTAVATAEGVRLAVCDDGSWKPPPESPGNRGHGLRVIAAMVDTVDVSPTPNGTTVEMTKELTR